MKTFLKKIILKTHENININNFDLLNLDVYFATCYHIQIILIFIRNKKEPLKFVNYSL